MSMRRLVETVFRYGACVTTRKAGSSTVDGWFRDEPRGRKALELQRRYAREACAGCPVRVECLVIALSHEQESGMSWGIWGGVCASDRASALHSARESAPDGAVNLEEVAGRLASGRWATRTMEHLQQDTVDGSSPLLAS
jgi:hypothetical protein